MKLNRLLMLVIPLFIFEACQKTEEVAVKSKKVSLQIFSEATLFLFCKLLE